MNHETSVETRAAERYLIGELSDGERDDFELHFFECEDCAREVRLGSSFAANAVAVFEAESGGKKRGQVVEMRPRRGAARLAMAAGVALCLFSGWQNAFRIPAMRSELRALETPSVVAPVVLAPSARAATARPVDASAGPVIPMSLAPGAALGAGPFECRLESSSGAVLWRGAVSSIDPDGGVSVLLPASGLRAGGYSWALFDAGGQRELERYRFELRRKD